MLQELPRYLGASWERTQELMVRYLGSDVDLLDKTNRTLLENGGKMVRPMICLLSAQAAGGRIAKASSHFAAASELLHTATLLHDDVVDGSPVRRGKPTVMSLLGGTASVLIGDFWLVKALECLLDAQDTDVERAVRVFSKTLTDLASGEMLQLQMAVSGETGEAEYLRIIHDKTASLFETAALTGAISVWADPNAEDALVEYARCVGMAFQIKDDIFDYTAGAQVGKPVGADILEQKITLPLLGAFINAGAKREAEVREQIRDIAAHPEYQGAILDFVARYDGCSYAVRRMEEYLQSAREALDPLPESEAKKWLLRVADFLGSRDS